jgi:general secretion pathway protein D
MNIFFRSPCRGLPVIVSLPVFTCLLAGLICSLQRADADPLAAGDFQSYQLENVRARDIEPTLSGLLPPEAEIVVDDRLNRILVSGSPRLHSYAQGAINSLDQVRIARSPAAPPVGPAPELKSYRLVPGQASQLAAKLDEGFGRVPGVRMVFDSRTLQILVTAPAGIHAQISERLSKATPAANVRPDSAPIVAGGLPGAREFQLQHITSEELNSRLLRTLGNRLSAIQSTSPGAVAYQLPLAGDARLLVSVEFRAHRVRVEGPGREVDSCVRMIRALDSPPLTANQGVSLVALRAARMDDIRKTAEAVAQRGNPAVVSRAGKSSGDNGMLVTQIFQQASQESAPAAAEPAAPAAPAAQASPPATAPSDTEEGSLVGPVQVEILEGIDMLIIKGDRRDVDQVARIIQEIEQLSAETKPAITVHHLLHVDCSAVATMVNQLYEDVFSARQGSVSITALVKPNALLLVGRDESVATVVDLVKQLDRPVEPETQFQVFRLEHAGAETAREMIEEFYEEREGLGTKVQVTADYRTNALIVQASPRDLDEVSAMLRKLDVGDSRVVNEVRIFKLNNSIAEDLQPVLENAITGDGREGGQQSDEKSIGLRFVTVDTGGQKLLKSGILTDVRITADNNANALLVSAPAESMPLIEALIAELDQLPAVEAQIKVFTIVEGDATNLMEMLEALFGTTTQGRSTSQPSVRTGAMEGDSSLVQLRFAVDARTNSIIVTGSAGDLNVVEAILLRLDEADVRDRRTTVIRLSNAPADNVAEAINEYLSNERQVQQIESEFKSAIELVEQEVVVVPELVSNSLIISATPRYFEEIEALVKQLDKRPPMVMIQVLIAEVQLNDTDEFGVELGLQDSLLFNRSLLGNLQTISTTSQTGGNDQIVVQEIVSATNTPGFLFNSTDPLGDSGADQALRNSSSVGAQGLSNFSLGRMNSELGFGGLVLSASSEAVSILIRALQEKRRVDILSRPQIMTLDNQPAYIQVGARVPIITGTATNEIGQTNNVAMENVGLILGVTPRVSPDNMVVMEVDAEKSEVGPESEGTPVSISEGQVIRSPRINRTYVQTTVSAADGQTVVLGGLITTNKSSVTRRVPALADIPILGHLFRYDATQEKRTELLIILTPRVVASEEDAELINQMESDRMNWCLCDVLELQDNVGFRARGDEWSDAETTTIYPNLDPLTEPVPGAVDDAQPAEEAAREPMPSGAREPTNQAPTIAPPVDNQTSYYRPPTVQGVQRATFVQNPPARQDQTVVNAYQVAPYVPNRTQPLPPAQSQYDYQRQQPRGY